MVYAAKTDKRLLGAELFAPGGEHLAHLVAWAIAQRMTAYEVLSMPFYHPVLEEGLRTAISDVAQR
jgi:dihydrolipoamide dehydrogenase